MLDAFHPSSLSLYWPMIVQGMMVSLALGLIGCFLVVRGMSLLGDALSHSILPGIVAGFLISAALGTASLHSPWILIGATAAGMGAAVLVEAVQAQSRVKEDASLGIVFTTLFALGVVMVNLYAGQSDLDPGCVLYGNLEYFASWRGEIPSGLWPMAGILVGVITALLLFYRQLLVSTFDPGLAVSLGIPARVVHYAVMAALSLSIVASFESVGVILPVALLILPGATARLWTDRMPVMLALASLHGVAATMLGYWLAHPSIMNTQISAAICVSGFVIFLLSWLLSPRHGLLPRWRTRAKLVSTTVTENLLRTLDELGGAAPAGRIAEELRMPPRAFSRLLQSAVAQGWIASNPRGFALTSAGRQRSAKLLRAHELWEQYLRQEVGLSADHVHDAAEWVEHYLSDEKIDRIDEVITKSTGAGRAP